jgi:predicted secreted protein with PEFG-CTERM motif
MKPVIIISIAFALLIPIPVFAVNITIIEVESNPAGYDEGNEWVRLFNPFSNSVDLTGWKISSTHGKTNTYTISENIGSCDSLKIVFSNQFIDNSGESLILYDKSQNVVDSTPIINDTSNDRTTWQGQTPTCVSTQKESPIVEEPIVEEPIVEEPIVEEPIVEEPEYLSNGCPVDYPYLWSDDWCYTTIERVYKEAEMGFYSNENFDFSLESPINWSYQENVTITEERMDELILFPSEFHISNAGDDVNMMDMQTAMMGWQWQFESPVIGMDYENIPTSKIKNMNENNIKDYYLDFIRETIPSAKMTDIYSKSHNYGWEVGVTYYYEVDFGIGQSVPYVGIDKAFFFNDREKYSFYYGSPEVYFDEYKPVYDHAVDTLTIKSVAVPEFGSIAMLILVISIVSVVIVSRKFVVMK